MTANALAARRHAVFFTKTMVSVGVLTLTLTLTLLGATGTGSRLLLDLSVFHHVALVPAAAFRATGASVLTGLGVAGMAAGSALFRRRDLAEA